MDERQNEILICPSGPLILFFVILMLCLSILLMSTGSAYSEILQSKQQGKKDLYYGCGGLYEVDCSRILNEFKNFKLNGPDDRLYLTVGYGGDLAAAQNKTSLLGKVLRINRDGTIPSDNPFPGSPVYSLP
jgi:hypothetical protein